jgi:hypothetical protein
MRTSLLASFLFACGGPPPSSSNGSSTDATQLSTEINAQTRAGVVTVAARDLGCEQARVSMIADGGLTWVNDHTLRAMFVLEGCGQRVTYVEICREGCRAVPIARLPLAGLADGGSAP